MPDSTPPEQRIRLPVDILPDKPLVVIPSAETVLAQEADTALCMPKPVRLPLGLVATLHFLAPLAVRVTM